MASDITITRLEAVGTVGQVALSALWAAPAGKSSLPYMQAANVDPARLPGSKTLALAQ
jgi:hypothetical protein